MVINEGRRLGWFNAAMLMDKVLVTNGVILVMSQFNPWPQIVSMLAGVAVAVPVVAAVPPVMASEFPQPAFADLCHTFQGTRNDWSPLLYSRPYAWQTMEALMSALATNDCDIAELRLSTVKDLRGPQLHTTYLPEHGLMVDFPMGVDVQIIAIATPNLTALNLSGHVITELAPITAFSQLQTLQVANTQLDDISPLKALGQLTSLDVSYNQINSIATVAAMPSLRSLNVAYNPLTDVSPIGTILTPATEQEWRLLDLSGIDIDTDTCPDNLGDICGDGLEVSR
ncbi:MAG: leucine-rich repeat domain-containing protein [Cyanobacteria bacterium P01_B01_bin.77]